MDGSSSHCGILLEAASSSEQQWAIMTPSAEKNCVTGDIEMTDIASDGSILGTNIPLDDITPFEGKEFISDKDAYNYYNAYAKKIGFGIRKDTLEKSKKASGEIISRTFVCNKAGKKKVPRENESGIINNRRPETRLNCDAKMKIRLTSSKTWKVTKFIAEHIHALTSEIVCEIIYKSILELKSNEVLCTILVID
ncbi:protein FAR1-RELATED SEQUENCE 5-like [Asparagus officinalis]|uniref:protein FAR1-RELATED SEQUENCE 5-like n=1 Tax=Asparagus officinalis TaxID=4686 RepID=UPI00098DFE8E|nr:protein FAR1-RELATED SEQUENCE 5-like [Asparagus officinalis]